ncbi:hypothetical protein ABFY27_11175 [Akkermansia massiliensis]
MRNWSMVSAALGAKAPGSLKSAIRELKNIPVEQGCRFKLMSVVNARALPVAKAIMAIPGLDQLTKATCAEMILGMDVRIFFEPKRKDDKPQPGEYSLNVDVQQPLGAAPSGSSVTRNWKERPIPPTSTTLPAPSNSVTLPPSPPWKPFPGPPTPNSAASGTCTPTRRSSAAPPSRACRK